MGLIADRSRLPAPPAPARAPTPTLPRADKPRGSLADVVRARRECVPCRAGKLPDDAARRLDAVDPRPYESLSWLRRWALAGRDPLADVVRYTSPPPDPGPQAVPIYGWVHAAVMGDWESILRELFSAVERSGLLAATSRVFVGVVGPEADLSWFPPWAEVVKRDGPLELGENSTLQALWDWSKGVPPSKVWYAHTKGASHPAGSPNVTAWRDYLTDFTILRWREAAAVLDGPHDCCGCDWTVRDDAWFAGLTAGERPDPGLVRGYGFEGNFWWARSEYLAALPPERVRLDRTRWDAEWSFVGAGDPRAFELHGPHVDLYNVFYPRSRYETSDR